MGVPSISTLMDQRKIVAARKAAEKRRVAPRSVSHRPAHLLWLVKPRERAKQSHDIDIASVRFVLALSRGTAGTSFAVPLPTLVLFPFAI